MCTSKPKVPKAAPVIQRQAYRSPAPRESLSSADPNRRRRVPGVVTSAQGDPSTASTTRKALGGDQQLSPSIGGGNGASVATSPAASGAIISASSPVVQALANKRGRPPSWKINSDMILEAA